MRRCIQFCTRFLKAMILNASHGEHSWTTKRAICKYLRVASCCRKTFANAAETVSADMNEGPRCLCQTRIFRVSRSRPDRAGKPAELFGNDALNGPFIETESAERARL